MGRALARTLHQGKLFHPRGVRCNQRAVCTGRASEPTVDELNKAIGALACGKAPSKDILPPEVIKSGKPALLEPLHELLCF